MKTFIIVTFLSAIALTTAQLQCTHRTANVPTDWIDMSNSCVKAMRDQIQEELRASMQYLAMGAHFSKDKVNRPGFADLFFKSASEEREHAIKLISYLLMRGELTSNVYNLIKKNIGVKTTEWASGVDALKAALNLEATVTKKIRTVIKECEDGSEFNDYHLVDYLTGEFLEEQYKGQKELATKISVLDKLMNKHADLGEFLFDKKLLAGAV